jgi:hypothetical protein
MPNQLTRAGELHPTRQRGVLITAPILADIRDRPVRGRSLVIRQSFELMIALLPPIEGIAFVPRKRFAFLTSAIG